MFFCKFISLLINSCKQFKISADVNNTNDNSNNGNSNNNNNIHDDDSNYNNNNNKPCGSEILGWHPAGDSCVSWGGRTLKPWLATFLREGKL